MNLHQAAQNAFALDVSPDEWSIYDAAEHAAANAELQARMISLALTNGMHGLVMDLTTCRPRFRLDGTTEKGRTDPCDRACCAGCGGRSFKDAAKFATEMILGDPDEHRGYVFTMPPDPAAFDVRLKLLAKEFSLFMATAVGKRMMPGCMVGFEGDWTRDRGHPHVQVVGRRGGDGTFNAGREVWRNQTDGRVSVRCIRNPKAIAGYVLKKFKYRPHALADDDELLAVLRLVASGFKFTRTYGDWNGNGLSRDERDAMRKMDDDPVKPMVDSGHRT